MIFSRCLARSARRSAHREPGDPTLGVRPCPCGTGCHPGRSARAPPLAVITRFFVHPKHPLLLVAVDLANEAVDRGSPTDHHGPRPRLPSPQAPDRRTVGWQHVEGRRPPERPQRGQRHQPVAQDRPVLPARSTSFSSMLSAPSSSSHAPQRHHLPARQRRRRPRVASPR